MNAFDVVLVFNAHRQITLGNKTQEVHKHTRGCCRWFAPPRASSPEAGGDGRQQVQHK